MYFLHYFFLTQTIPFYINIYLIYFDHSYIQIPPSLKSPFSPLMHTSLKPLLASTTPGLLKTILFPSILLKSNRIRLNRYLFSWNHQHFFHSNQSCVLQYLPHSFHSCFHHSAPILYHFLLLSENLFINQYLLSSTYFLLHPYPLY